jgi:hypothetical protein
MPAIWFHLPESGLMVTAYWGRTKIETSDRMRASRAAGFARHGASAHLRRARGDQAPGRRGRTGVVTAAVDGSR